MRKTVLIPIVVATLLAAFCSSDKTANPEEECIRRTSPDSLLLALACAYEARDISEYEEVFHDQFLFVFTPEVSESLGLPGEQPWWGRTEDAASTARLFADTSVTDIDFSYGILLDWLSCDDTRPDTTYSGYCCRMDPHIYIEILQPDEEDPIDILLVDRSYLEITAVPDPHRKGLWVILRIEDHRKQYVTYPVSAEPSYTWGEIKALWAQD